MDVNLGQEAQTISVMSEDRAKGGWDRKLCSQAQNLAEQELRGLNAGTGLIPEIKYSGGIKGFLRNGFNLTLTLNVMSREDSDLGSQETWF